MWESPLWLIVQAVLAAFPFAWATGVLIARLVAGPEFGVLPALTIPITLVAAIIFAFSSGVAPTTRRNMLVGGAVVSFIGMYFFI